VNPQIRINFFDAAARKQTPHAGFIEFGGDNITRCCIYLRWARGRRVRCAPHRASIIIMLAITKSRVMGHERVLIRIIYPSHFYVILEERRSRSIHHHYLHGHGNIARSAHTHTHIMCALSRILTYFTNKFDASDHRKHECVSKLSMHLHPR
jgi:hypothetical protein